VLEENLENAITFKKSESGYHQNPINRDLGLTKSQNGQTSFQHTTFATQLSIAHAQRPNGAKASLANGPYVANVFVNVPNTIGNATYLSKFWTFQFLCQTQTSRQHCDRTTRPFFTAFEP